MRALTSIAAAAVLFFSIGSPQAGGSFLADTSSPRAEAAEKQKQNPNPNPNQKVFSHLQDAYQTQVSLSSKERSKTEMKSVLSPYFTDNMADVYLKYNAVKGEEKYIVYGTDFPILSIPFFSYSSDTKVLDKGNKKIVYQYFEAVDEGPVTYEGHYESVTLVKTDTGWKVAAIKESLKAPE
ncbi:DUF3993 domain-containing protein [Metabacillus sp. 84]|uniref:DUF3993 domain-containing protein n=1 Tax=unclassified Metabacillus TaxID=2675274 RepID=UPI003CF9FB6B